MSGGLHIGRLVAGGGVTPTRRRAGRRCGLWQGWRHGCWVVGVLAVLGAILVAQ